MNMEISLQAALAVDVLCALVAHQWFRKREPSVNTVLFSTIFICTTPATILLYPTIQSILSSVSLSFGVFVFSLLGSIAVYRLSPLHPLYSIPGPALCKLTKLWTAWIASRGKLHIYHKNLHEQYGPLVRVGPNEVSVVDKDLIPLILGNPGMPKGPLWGGRRFTPAKSRNTNDNLISVPDLQRHAQLRKPWNKCFGPGPMKDYEDILVKRGAQLVQKLEGLCVSAQDGRGCLDIAEQISFFSFDFMGDLAFGGGFELMRDGDKDGAWHKMEEALYLPSVAQHIPWSGDVLRALPKVGSSMQAFGKFAVHQTQLRSTQDIKQKDLFYHLLNAMDADPVVSPFPLLVSNAVLTIIAGSDTTALVLCNIVYYLLSNPLEKKRLVYQIDQIFPPLESTPIDSSQLSQIPILDWIIDETMRLQPAVPTSLQRAPAKGSGGKQIGTLFVPKGTALVVPPYVLHRDPRYFSPSPDKFISRRWSPAARSDYRTTPGAFIPFSTGPANCAGKTLAMLELRYMIALLFRTFDIEFQKGYRSAQWEEDLKDMFVLAKGALPVVLTRRLG